MIARPGLFNILLIGALAVGQIAIPDSDARNTLQTDNKDGRILGDVPREVDVNAEYLFYLHGRIVEERGVRPTSEQHGVYEYEQILDTFKSRGFIVISEPRAKGTDARLYGSKVAQQIQKLLKARVPASRITVVGASKGAIIAMLTSTYLRNRNVNFAVLCNCNDSILKSFDIDLYGNVLSIYDVSDEFGGSCKKFFKRASGLNRSEEIELKTGLGHGVIYRPIPDWVDPVVRWARTNGRRLKAKAEAR
jgi:hypothetical protein